MRAFVLRRKSNILLFLLSLLLEPAFQLLQSHRVGASSPSLGDYPLITIIQLPIDTLSKRSGPNLNSNNLFLLPSDSFHTILT